MSPGTIPAVVLAAGGSTRFGGPKQQLEFRGKTLLGRAAEAAAESFCDPVYVVLGANAPELSVELSGLPVLVVVNPEWETGIGSSIKAGLQAAIQTESEPEAMLFMTVDQPLVTSLILNRLVETYRLEHPPIVTCSYEETAGIPALFDRSLFSSLGSLVGDRGAKSIIERHLEGAVLIDCPEAAFDIDTEEDLNRLLEM